MFTGIITNVGEVLERTGGHFHDPHRLPAASIAIGASIACDGCCLTVTSVAADAHGSRFSVDASNETRAKTTIGRWQPGRSTSSARSRSAPSSAAMS